LKLIRQNDSPPLFWLNLASIHYSNDVFSWYEANNVAYVAKKHNPPNSPELRPIERYWALWQRNIKKRSSATSDINLFKQKVNGAIKTIDSKVVQNLMSGLKGKVGQFGRGEYF
jgi:transposase